MSSSEQWNQQKILYYLHYLLRRPFRKIKLVGTIKLVLTATQAFVSNLNLRTRILITGCMACGGGSYLQQKVTQNSWQSPTMKLSHFRKCKLIFYTFWESYIPRFTFTIIDLYVLVSYYSMYNMKLVLHIFEDGSQIDLY